MGMQTGDRREKGGPARHRRRGTSRGYTASAARIGEDLTCLQAAPAKSHYCDKAVSLNFPEDRNRISFNSDFLLAQLLTCSTFSVYLRGINK